MSKKMYQLLRVIYGLEKHNAKPGEYFPETFEQWLGWIDNGF